MDEVKTQGKNDDPVQPFTPIGISNKETGPIRASEQEPILHPEVAASGVEKISEQPNLNEEHEKIGVRASAESTIVSTEPKGFVHLPMTNNEIKDTLKEGIGSETDIKKHFEGIYFARARYFLATLLDKINKKLVKQTV